MLKDVDFREWLVLEALGSRPQSLVEIARRCRGLYPLDLRVVLDDLIASGLVVQSANGYERVVAVDSQPADYERSAITRSLLILPFPHPHDYDWRFTRTTARYIANQLVDAWVPGGNILLLGAPSVFVELAIDPAVPRTVLVDGSHELVRFLQRQHVPASASVVHGNLLATSGSWHGEQATAVLCAPPWYPEHYIAFLAHAAVTASIGARIFVSLLPVNTRPSAVDDRWKVFEIAQRLGLDCERLIPGVIRYEMPLFEQVSLQAAGLLVDYDWRAGDLLVLRKVRQLASETLVELLSSSCSHEVDDEWHEVLVGRHKVKLRGPLNNPEDVAAPPVLFQIEEHNILPTVSRRYAGRAAIDLWFWDNRVFGVQCRLAFLAALQTLAGQPVSFEADALSAVQRQAAVDLLQEAMYNNVDEQFILW